MKQINIGIIGVGLIGNTHAMTLMTCIEEEVFKGKAEIKLKGFADVDENVLKQRGGLYDVDFLTKNGHELCESKDIDTIYICTPTRFHHEFFMSAVKNGKNVFVEKPVGTSTQVKEMIQARDEHKATVQVGLVLRYEPLFWYIKKGMDEHKKDFGPLQNIIFRDDQEYPYTGSGNHPSTWRADKAVAYHGTLFEHSIHDLDELIYYCGKVDSLAASIKFFNKKEEIEDSASVLLNFKNGTTASLNSIWYAVNRDSRRGEFYFKNAVMEFDASMIGTGSLQYKILNQPTTKVSTSEMTAAFLKEVFPGLKVPPGLSYFYENVGFMRSIIENKPTYPGLEIALEVHEILEKCYESSRLTKFLNK
nr:Gfo/Idh/MocA family oxidoreductase [Candidatus Sigynarchaeota archaeon]